MTHDAKPSAEVVRKVAVAINGIGSHLPPKHAWKMLGSNERKHQDNKARAAIEAYLSCTAPQAAGVVELPAGDWVALKLRSSVSSRNDLFVGTFISAHHAQLAADAFLAADKDGSPEYHSYQVYPLQGSLTLLGGQPEPAQNVSASCAGDPASICMAPVESPCPRCGQDNKSAPAHPRDAESAEVAALTFDEFRRANAARCVKWHPEGIASWSPSDWLTAVTGELGELASLLKMRNRERDGLAGNKFSPTDRMIADELADVLTYLDLLAEVLGVNLGEAAARKFNEVSERIGFPDRIRIPEVRAATQEVGRERSPPHPPTADGSPTRARVKYRRYLRWKILDYEPPIDPEFDDPA